MDIVKSHASNKLNTNSTSKRAAKVLGKLNQSKGKRDTKGMQPTKASLGRVLKEKMGTQSNARPVSILEV